MNVDPDDLRPLGDQAVRPFSDEDMLDAMFTRPAA
jgi:hypothetical protein